MVLPSVHVELHADWVRKLAITPQTGVLYSSCSAREYVNPIIFIGSWIVKYLVFCYRDFYAFFLFN